MELRTGRGPVRKASEEEFDDVRRAAARSGQARGAFAAEATLASARGLTARTSSPLREALVEVMAAAGLVRRVGTKLEPGGGPAECDRSVQ